MMVLEKTISLADRHGCDESVPELNCPCRLVGEDNGKLGLDIGLVA